MRRRAGVTCRFGALAGVLVPGKEGLPQMHAGQRPADDCGADQGHVADGLENDADAARGVAGLCGLSNVLDGVAELLQLLWAWRPADAVSPAGHARAFWRWSRGRSCRDRVSIPS